VIAVCQPSVPVLAATALMESVNDPYAPRSIGADGRPDRHAVQSHRVNKLAQERGNRLVPPQRHHQGAVPASRRPCATSNPGFLQLNGFVSMNLDRHLDAHKNLFFHLVKGDGDSVHKAQGFLRRVSGGDGLGRGVLSADRRNRVVRHALPKGEMTHRRHRGRSEPDPQLRAAHRRGRARRHFRRRPDRSRAPALSNIPAERKAHYLQLGVGHYGVFNGSRFRAETAPRIADFMLTNNGRRRSCAAISRSWVSRRRKRQNKRSSCPRVVRGHPRLGQDVDARRIGRA